MTQWRQGDRPPLQPRLHTRGQRPSSGRNGLHKRRRGAVTQDPTFGTGALHSAHRSSDSETKGLEAGARPPPPGPDAQSWRARCPWEDPRVGLGSVSKAITKAGGHRPATLWPHRGGGCSCAWRYHHNADSSGVLWHLPPAPGEPFLSGGAAANADLSEPGSKGQQAAASLFPSHS